MREFLHADDMADACVFLLENYSGFQHVNVGSQQEMTIMEIARLIARVVGYEGQILTNPVALTERPVSLWTPASCSPWAGDSASIWKKGYVPHMRISVLIISVESIMLKAQLVEAFKRIYSVLSPALQHSFWTVMALAVVVALAEFALAGAVSLLGVVLASPQTIVQSNIMQQLVLWLPALQPAMADPRLLLALLCLLCGTTLLKTMMLALLTWHQSQYAQ